MIGLKNPASFTALPREFYLDNGLLFEAEMSRVWNRQWLYFGHASEIPNPGDYVVRNRLGESVIVIRTSDGEIAAMLNVCRHRGARIVDSACGHLKRVVCPYHQWTYELDGSLRAAPSMPDGEAIDYQALGLYRLPLEVWGGFVFGCLGDTAPLPQTPEIGKLAPRLSGYAPERMRSVESRTYDCNANWKVMLENYLECYHCAGSHPEFCITADPRIRASDEFNEQAFHDHPYWGMDVAMRKGSKSASLTGEYVCRVPLGDGDGFSVGRSCSFGGWSAGAVLYFYADYAMVHEIQPVSAVKTQFQLTWFVSEDAQDSDFDLDDLVHVWDMTTRQDVELIERTQDGMKSRRYTPGPLSISHEPFIRSSLNTYLAIMDGEPVVDQLLRNAAVRE